MAMDEDADMAMGWPFHGLMEDMELFDNVLALDLFQLEPDVNLEDTSFTFTDDAFFVGPAVKMSQQPSTEAGGSPRSGPPSAEPRVRRTRYSLSQLRVLHNWVLSHLRDPYASEKDRSMLCAKTGLSPKQVKTFLTNFRRRKVPRCDRVDDMVGGNADAVSVASPGDEQPRSTQKVGVDDHKQGPPSTSRLSIVTSLQARPASRESRKSMNDRCTSPYSGSESGRISDKFSDRPGFASFSGSLLDWYLQGSHMSMFTPTSDDRRLDDHRLEPADQGLKDNGRCLGCGAVDAYAYCPPCGAWLHNCCQSCLTSGQEVCPPVCSSYWGNGNTCPDMIRSPPIKPRLPTLYDHLLQPPAPQLPTSPIQPPLWSQLHNFTFERRPSSPIDLDLDRRSDASSMQSKGSHCSYASLGSRQGRRAHVQPPATPHTTKSLASSTDQAHPEMFYEQSRSPSQIPPCDLCSTTFKSAFARKRHMSSVHSGDRTWLCGGPLVSLINLCQFCLPSQLWKSCPHRLEECWSRPKNKRIFYRKDSLLQHFRVYHRVEGQIKEAIIDGMRIQE